MGKARWTLADAVIVGAPISMGNYFTRKEDCVFCLPFLKDCWNKDPDGDVVDKVS